MILSDRDIVQRLLDSGPDKLEIDPLEDAGVQVQPCSVDLRLNPFTIVPGPGLPWARSGSRPYPLQPGEFVLGGTVERVRMPRDLVGRVDGRSSWGRRGLMIHVTAGLIDPGFDGQITLEIKNVGTDVLHLVPGVRICQLVLEQLSSPAWEPYGFKRGSSYGGQQSAPVAAPELRPDVPSGVTLQDLWNKMTA